MPGSCGVRSPACGGIFWSEARVFIGQERGSQIQPPRFETGCLKTRGSAELLACWEAASQASVSFRCQELLLCVQIPCGHILLKQFPHLLVIRLQHLHGLCWLDKDSSAVLVVGDVVMLCHRRVFSGYTTIIGAARPRCCCQSRIYFCKCYARLEVDWSLRQVAPLSLVLDRRRRSRPRRHWHSAALFPGLLHKKVLCSIEICATQVVPYFYAHELPSLTSPFEVRYAAWHQYCQP
jgi:hypothetical protein